MDGLVYIIVPVYNDEKYLHRCFCSLFNQTYKNIAIIAVNDGSTDKSFELLNIFSNAHKNIVIITKENGGLSSARNAGLGAINYFEDCYVMFVDADDYIEKDYVEVMVNIMKQDKADIVCSNHYWFDSEMTEDKTYDPSKNGSVMLDRNKAIISLFNGEIQSHIPTKLYKGNLWIGRLFDESVRFMEDQRITYKLFNDANLVSYTSYQGYNYYSNPKSLVRSSFNNRKVLEGLGGYFEAVMFYEKHDNVLLLKYARKAFASAFLMLYPRFCYKDATEDEIEIFKNYLNYVNNNQVIKRVVFTSKKDKWKRSVYLISKRFYVFLYKHYTNTKNRYL